MQQFDELQNKQLSASSGKHLTIDVFKRMRNDDLYNLFFELVLVKDKKIQFIDNPQLPRKRKATRNYSMLHFRRNLVTFSKMTLFAS